MRSPGLWRHPDFLKLWLGQTVSLFGSQITLLALPLTAALTLDATPGQMGLLSATGSVPTLLFGLVAGVWVDRQRRRPILIATNVGRAAPLAIVPAAAALETLRIELLYAVAFGTGILTVFFRVAYSSYLPSLVSRENLVEGNSRLQVSQSAAQVAGPGLTGVLVELTTAPIAIAADALSYVVSAVSLLLIRRREAAPVRPQERPKVAQDVREGLAVVLHDPVLRSIGGWAGTFNLFGAVVGAVLLLYATRELGLSAGVVGLVLAAGSVGGLLSAILTGRVTRTLGIGRTMVWGAVLAGTSQLLLPLASGPAPAAVAILIASNLAFGLAVSPLSVNIMTLQQAVTPDRLLGRVNATMQVVISGTLPAGALLGGALGATIGLRPTLLVGALGIWLSTLWIWNSPLRSIEGQPSPMSGGRAPPEAPA